MNPFSSLFGAVVDARNNLYDRGTLHSRRLRAPVVSIGNISVGGSGKTPLLIHIGELLKERGIRFDVLSRGYGRTSVGIAVVDPAGSPSQFGDEPLLISRKLGVPVIVGEDRYLAGQDAENKFDSQLHLLDDGFQHRRLARDFDIVLITAEDAEDELLPAGRLREPVAALARADAIVLMEGASPDGLALTHQQVWRLRRDIVVPKVEGSCIAFCGIARPERFFEQLSTAGITLAAMRTFRDHHAYSDSDVRQLLKLRQHSAAPAFVTTEKDAINLGQKAASLAPLNVVVLRTELEGHCAAIDSLLTTIAERRTQAS